ncbi:hypothetical protein KA068_00830, partial [Candidatus Saccharibacteria bacterium]|nr:hypothetical protein [Candidatus Saccharibacteria bacterium]
MQNVHEFLTSPEALVDVSIDKKTGIIVDDDGCGDGREVSIVFKGGDVKNKSLVRPKVFGGAPVMALAAKIGNNEVGDSSLQVLFDAVVDSLVQSDIDFGGHCDSNADNVSSGCGAIDRAPEIIDTVVGHQTKIKEVIELLGLETNDLEDEGGVFANYDRYRDALKADELPYSGAVALRGLKTKNKVVKELGGKHKEVAVVLNLVEGKTVNQQKVREISGGAAQVFAVDVWRLQSIAARLYPNDESK